MRTTQGSVVASLVALTLAACTQFAVHSRSDPSANFGRLHTFAWLPVDEAAPADQRTPDRLIDRRIREDVESDLRAKGYQPANGTAPDFLINYRFASKVESTLVGYGTAWGGWWNAWAGADDLYVESYDRGALYLAVLDPNAKHMIWVGVAEAPLLEFASIEKRYGRVDDAVKKILAGFPPR